MNDVACRPLFLGLWRGGTAPSSTNHWRLMVVGACVSLIAACGGGGDGNNAAAVAAAIAAGNQPSVPPPTQQLECNDSIKTGFKPDAQTSVLLVRAFKGGDPLLLSGTADASTPIAKADVCVVKLRVGPGNPGPADAPSTSAGIGIEIWLPSKAKWNNRIHSTGGGGWVGGPAGSTIALAGVPLGLPFEIPNSATFSTVEGAVSATTDTGHAQGTADFAMNPDGTINTALWRDCSERAVHEMAVKTKALTKAYYGRDAQYAYFDGGSSSGRQALKEAQVHPEDFDGILAGWPAINWSKFISYELYPQIVFQRDLGGVPLTLGQGSLVGKAAINACDTVGGQHLGYILDPSTCRYDPTKDVSVLCTSAGGSNSSATCLSMAQATAVNKIWYGMTRDGSVPDPAMDNGWAPEPTGKHMWYGVTRGTSFFNGFWGLGSETLFAIGPEMAALSLQDPTLAPTNFRNATGNGADGWKTLSYEQLAHAFDRGVALQSAFADINTDSPNLSGFRDRKGKLLLWHGTNDELIPIQGSINYYTRVAGVMGGIGSVQDFFRFYMVPGMSHVPMNGTANEAANPPLPTGAQMYEALTSWVEKGVPPASMTVSTTTSPVKTGIICPYPQKITYQSGDPTQAGGYACQ